MPLEAKVVLLKTVIKLSFARLMYLKVYKKQKQWVTFKVSELEMSALETYCRQTQRTKTDVLRGLLRGLPTYSNSPNNSSNSLNS